MARSEHLLVTNEAPKLLGIQLALFDRNRLRTSPVAQFNPAQRLAQLQSQADKEVLTIDLGGDKARAAVMMQQDGRMEAVPGTAPIQIEGVDGEGYLKFLVMLAEVAARKNLPFVSISTAGLVQGTRLIESPNLPKFIAGLRDNYGGDLAQLFETDVSVTNDAVAGMIAGAIEVARTAPNIKNIIYLINGGGVGGAVLTDGQIWAAEPGHIPAVSELNPFGQDRPCGVGSAQYVCIERIAASGAGIESIYHRLTGEQLPGEAISQLYQSGDRLAKYLYEYSAWGVTHVVTGTGKAFGLFEGPRDTAVVFHGGCFRVPGYSERVSQMLSKQLGFQPITLITHNFSENACLSGAAIAALTAPRN